LEFLSKIYRLTKDLSKAKLFFSSKDLWSDDSTESASDRSNYVGTAFLAGACRSNRYSIIEDTGLKNIQVLSHELGHLLGSNHDSILDGETCPESDNYIMTPVSGIYSNTQNHIYFSSCSINRIKSMILSEGY
jgi:hypothetical protein